MREVSFFYKKLGEEQQKVFSEYWNGKWYAYLHQYKTSVLDGNCYTSC